ncbi:putative pdz-domain-containing protein, partial [Globisporangium splendens]
MTKNNYDDDDDDLFKALQSMEPCGNCGADGAKIPCMSGCGEVFYCSRFNDSESESDSDDYEEFTDDDSDDAEYETDSGEDDDEEEEEEEEEVKSKKKSGKGKGGKGKGKGKMKRTNSSRSEGEGGSGRKISVDAEVEKRIEEKILRRLKKQEESRIATAIEQRMREEKANWRDDEMNRIIMEMRERFQSEMSNPAFLAALSKMNGVDGAAIDGVIAQHLAESAMSGAAANPQAEEKMPAIGADDAAMRNRSASKESSWNNACLAFEALRVVVWKHSFLPRIKFEKNASDGIYNSISQLDPDEAFRHIELGDRLTSVNGRAIDEAIQTEEDLDDVFAAFASPLVLKFDAKNPGSDKVHDYTVTWSNGPLGVTLKDDCVNQKIPIVNRLTKKAGSVAMKQNIMIGDILVAINNIDTIQLGCSLSMSILKKVQLPAKLRFRGVGGPPPGSEDAQNDDEEVEKATAAVGGIEIDKKEETNSASLRMSSPAAYTINWAEGPLGLTIIPGIDEGDLPVIKKVTGTGTSKGIEKAQVGDLLESMNDISTASMHFEKVVSYLKSAPKPVLLQFRSAAAGEPKTAAEVTVQRSAPARVPSTPLISRSSLDSVATSSSSRGNGSNDFSKTMPLPSHAPAHNQGDSYKVVWGDGPLGLTIDAIPNSSGAYIKRISSQGAAANLSQDCTGDELTHINDMNVSTVVFQDIVAQLKNVPRPVTLYFRRRGSNARPQSRLSESPVPGRKLSARDEPGAIHYYNVVWQEGTPLGLSLRGADTSCEYPYITRVTGSGSAAHLPNSVINDCLISVDGRSVHVRDKSFEEVMNMLKVMQKPLTLKFQSRGGTSHLQRPGSSSNLQHAPQMQQQAYQQHAPQQYQQQPPPQYQQQPPPQYQQQPPPQYQQQPPPQPHQQSHTWRQNQNPHQQRPGGGGPAQFSQSYNGAASAPHPDLAASKTNNLSRSFLGTSERALDSAAGNEEKFSNIHSPFLVQNKLSTGRRQKMLKGLKK